MVIFKLVRKILIGGIILVISLVLIGLVYEQISRFISNKKCQPDGKFVELGDHKLHFIKKGNGAPTVIFESGLDPGGHLPWFKVQTEISKFTTTISYDRAGVLWSDRGNNPKTGKAMSRELLDLLKNNNCPKPYIVVGHSLAGLFLRNFIEENKSDISGVIFIDVSHPEQNIHRPKNLKALSKAPSTNLVKFANATGLLRLFYNQTYPNTIRNDSINLIAHALFYKSCSVFIEEQNAIDSLLKESKTINSFDSIPLAIITAISPNKYTEIKDQKLRSEFLEFKLNLHKDLLNLSKNSELVIVSESGHYVQLEQPDIVINSIKKMIVRKSVEDNKNET